MSDSLLIKERMKKLGHNRNELVERSLIDGDIVDKLLDGEIKVDDLNYTDSEFLCSVLRCPRDYFKNEDVGKNDILNIVNCEDIYINRRIATMQDAMEDFSFIMEIYNKLMEGKNYENKIR